MHIVNRRNNKTMEWLSEVRYVGVLMPESCFPVSNKLTAPLMSILIESHRLANRQVLYREKLKGNFLSACWAIKNTVEVGLLFCIVRFHNAHNHQHVKRTLWPWSRVREDIKKSETHCYLVLVSLFFFFLSLSLICSDTVKRLSLRDWPKPKQKKSIKLSIPRDSK